jgi:hypothetical protein
MKVELDKIGKGCDTCVNKGDKFCPKCERNPNLLQLKDFFKKKEIGPPPRVPGGLPGNVPKVSEGNRSTLAEWGMRVPGADHFQPCTPAQQEPQGEAGEQERPSSGL